MSWRTALDLSGLLTNDQLATDVSTIAPRDLWDIAVGLSSHHATLMAEIKRLRDLLNNYAAAVGRGPLACKLCGVGTDAIEHRPSSECLYHNDSSGGGCWEPGRHHEFEPGDEL